MRTRYERIAARYDEARPSMHGVDEFLAARLATVSRRPFAVLDVGCGTGSWLAAQASAMPDAAIRWHGMDATAEMLAVARAKVAGCRFLLGRAEALPYADASMDFVVTTFAFHHFVDKTGALDEMRRVSQPAGTLRIVNIVPEAMANWWVYQFFPETRDADAGRFWSVERIRQELAGRGYRVEAEIHKSAESLRLDSLLERAEIRDTSQLDIIDDGAYRSGLDRLRAAISDRTDAAVESEFALLDCPAYLD